MNETAKRIDRPYLFVDSAEDIERPKRIRIAEHSPPPEPPPVPRRTADHDKILRCVCQSYLVSPGELAGNDRHKNIAEARIVAYWLLRVVGKMSFPEIGRAMGGKDHTTAMSGVRRCQKRRAEDDGFRSFTDELAAAAGGRA